jgi:hypothetical protein
MVERVLMADRLGLFVKIKMGGVEANGFAMESLSPMT